jgi:hypothetical protein
MEEDDPEIAGADPPGRLDKVPLLEGRVTPIQPVRPMTIMIFQMEGSRSAITARIRKKVGKQSMMSTNRMMIASTQRP